MSGCKSAFIAHLQMLWQHSNCLILQLQLPHKVRLPRTLLCHLEPAVLLRSPLMLGCKLWWYLHIVHRCRCQHLYVCDACMLN